jgi:hypothetical protein
MHKSAEQEHGGVSVSRHRRDARLRSSRKGMHATRKLLGGGAASWKNVRQGGPCQQTDTSNALHDVRHLTTYTPPQHLCRWY